MTYLPNLVQVSVLMSALLAASSYGQTRDGSFGTADVVVTNEAFVLGGRWLNDLGALEAAVRTVNPKTIEIRACGQDATANLKAATQRLSEFPLHIQVANAASHSCAVGSVSTRVSVGAGAAGVDYAAVEAYWQQVTP